MYESESQQGHTEAGKLRKAEKVAYLSRCGQGLGQAGGMGELPRLTVTGSYCHLQGQREGGVARTWGQLLQEEEPHAGCGYSDGEGGVGNQLTLPAPPSHLGHKARGEGRRVDLEGQKHTTHPDALQHHPCPMAGCVLNTPGTPCPTGL